MYIPRNNLPTNLIPAQRDALIRGKLSDSDVWQPPLLFVEEVIVVRIGSVAELKAESVPIVRPAALFSFLFPPQIMGVPAVWHGEIHLLSTDRGPACNGDMRIACPCQSVFLRIMIVPVVELVVMTETTVLVWALAVAFCDI